MITSNKLIFFSCRRVDISSSFLFLGPPAHGCVLTINCIFICRLQHNPVCDETGTTWTYCKQNIPNTKPENNCPHTGCSSDQVLSPKCKCAYPYTGTLTYRAPSCFDWRNVTSIEADLMQALQSKQIPVESVKSIPNDDPFRFFEFVIQIFPLGQDCFSQTQIFLISSVLVNLRTDRAYDFFPDNNYGN